MSRFRERFATIGKSGLWGLAEWDLVQSTIVSAMIRCFHEMGKPSTAGDLYKCVRKYRSDAKLTSISAFLVDRPEFVQVGWGSYQPREWKITDEIREQRKQIRQTWNKEQYAKVIVDIFDRHGVDEMLLRELAEELSAASGRPADRLMSNVLSKTPAIRTELVGKGRRKKAIVIRDYKFEERVTLRQQMESLVHNIDPPTLTPITSKPILTITPLLH